MPFQVSSGGGQSQVVPWQQQENMRRRLNLLMQSTNGMIGDTPDTALALASDPTLTDDQMIRGATAAMGETQMAQMVEGLAAADKQYQYSYYASLPTAMQQELVRAGYQPIPEEDVVEQEGDGFFDWKIPFTGWVRDRLEDITPFELGEGNLAFTGTAGYFGAFLGGPGFVLQRGVEYGLEAFNKISRNWNRINRFYSELAQQGPTLGLDFTQALATGNLPLAFGQVWAGAAEINAQGVMTLWDRVGDGEEYTQDDNILRAAEILGGTVSDPVASYWATDPNANPTSTAGKLWIARKTAGGHTVGDIAEEFGYVQGTDEYNEFVVEVYRIQSEPEFQEALLQIEQGKVSFGRNLARGIGLYDNPDSSVDEYKIQIPLLGATTLGGMVSGGGDFAWAIFGDPTNVVGSVSAARKASMLFKVDDLRDVLNAAKTYAAVKTGARSFIDSRTGLEVVRGTGEWNRAVAKMGRVDETVKIVSDHLEELVRMRASGASTAEINRMVGRFSNVHPRISNVIEGLYRYIETDDAARGLADVSAVTDEIELGARLLDDTAGLDRLVTMHDRVWRYMITDKGRTAIASTNWAGINPRFAAMPNMTHPEKWMIGIRRWAWSDEAASSKTGLRLPGAGMLDIPARAGGLDDTIEATDQTLSLLARYTQLPKGSQRTQLIRDLTAKTLDDHLTSVYGSGAERVKASLRTPVAAFLRAFLRHVPHNQTVLTTAGHDTQEFLRAASQLMLAKVPQRLIDEYVGAWHMGNEAERAALALHMVGDILVRTGALTQSGRHGDAAWAVWERNVTRLYHSYSHIPGGDTFIYRGLDTKAGLFPTDFDFRIMMPRFRDLAYLSGQMGMLRRLGMPITAGMFDSMMKRYWVPAQLMRIGFIPRAAGEELISFMLREGPSGYIASMLGKRATGYMQTHRLEKLAPDEPVLILGSEGRATVKVTDLNRQSAILAPATGFTNFLRVFARTSGKDLLDEAEQQLMNHTPGFRFLPPEERMNMVVEQMAKLPSTFSRVKRATIKLDDYAWWWSHKLAVFVHQIAANPIKALPTPMQMGQKLYGQENFLHMTQAATRLMTNPLVASAHARQLGQSYSRYANVGNLEGSITLEPVFKDGSVRWMPTRPDISTFDEVRNPATGMDDVAPALQRAEAGDMLVAWGQQVQEIAQSPLGNALLKQLMNYQGARVRGNLSGMLGRAGFNPSLRKAEYARDSLLRSLETAKTHMVQGVDFEDTVQRVQRMPGVGPAKAEAIAKFLRDNPTVTELSRLTDIPGITERMVQQWVDEGFGLVGRYQTVVWEDELSRWVDEVDRFTRGGPDFDEVVNSFTDSWYEIPSARRNRIYEAFRRGQHDNNYEKARELVEKMPAGDAQDVLRIWLNDPDAPKDVLPVLISPNAGRRIMEPDDLFGDGTFGVRSMWSDDLAMTTDWMLADGMKALYPEYTFHFEGGKLVHFEPDPNVSFDAVDAARAFRDRALRLIGDKVHSVEKVLPDNIDRWYFPVIQPAKTALLRELLVGAPNPHDTYVRFVTAVLGDGPSHSIGLFGPVGSEGLVRQRQLNAAIKIAGLTEETTETLPRMEEAMRELIDTLVGTHELGHATTPVMMFGRINPDEAQLLTKRIDDWIISEAKARNLTVPLAPSNAQTMAYLDVPNEGDNFLTFLETAGLDSDPDVMELGWLPLRHSMAAATTPIAESEYTLFQEVRSLVFRRDPEVEDFSRVDDLPFWPRTQPGDQEYADEVLVAFHNQMGLSDQQGNVISEVMDTPLYHGSLQRIDELKPLPEQAAYGFENRYVGNYMGPGLYTATNPAYSELYLANYMGDPGQEPLLYRLEWNDFSKPPMVVDSSFRFVDSMPAQMQEDFFDELMVLLSTDQSMILPGMAPNLWDTVMPELEELGSIKGLTLGQHIEMLRQLATTSVDDGITLDEVWANLNKLIAGASGIDDTNMTAWFINKALANVGVDGIRHWLPRAASDDWHVLWMSPDKLTFGEVRAPIKVMKAEQSLDLRDAFRANQIQDLIDLAAERGGIRVMPGRRWAGAGQSAFDQSVSMVRDATDRVIGMVTRRDNAAEGDDAFNWVIDGLLNLNEPSKLHSDAAFQLMDAFTDVVPEDLPMKLFAPRRVVASETTWEHITRSMWDGMISPAIDALFRNNFYLYAYAQAEKQTRFVLTSGLRAHAKMMEDQGRDASELIAKTGLNDKMLEELVSTSWQQAQLTDDVINASDPLVQLARALQYQVSNLMTGEYDEIAAKRMAQHANGALRALRMRAGLPYNVKFSTEQWLTIQADLRGRAGVYKDWIDHATHRANELVIPYIDDHNIRSQFQEYIGTLIPFWFAEEQFLKRWARGMYAQPAMLRRGQILMNGLRHMGVIRSDDQGNEYFVYPGSQMLFEVTAPLTRAVFGETIGTVVTGPLSTRTSYMFPGLSGEQLGQFQWGPMAAIPVQLAADRFPEFNSFRDNMLGETAQIRDSAMDYLMPVPLQNLYRGFLGPFLNATNVAGPGFEKDQLLSAQYQALAIAAANDKLPGENASAADMQDFLNELDNTARLILTTRAATSFVLGASGQQIDWDKVEIDKQFQELLDSDLPFDDAVHLFLTKNPNATAFTVFATRTESGSPIAATDESFNWMTDNDQFISNYRMLSPWFIPTGESEEWGSKERRARNHAMATGLRITQSPRELLDSFYIAEAAEDFFDIDDTYEIDILSMQMQGDLEGARQKKDERAYWKQSYFEQHPIFAEMMMSTTGRQRRADLVSEARLVMSTVQITEDGTVLDPGIVPDTPHRDPLLAMLHALVQYSDAYANLYNIQAGGAQDKRDELALALYETTRQIAEEYPELMSFWNSNIRPIVSDVELQAQLAGVV